MSFRAGRVLLAGAILVTIVSGARAQDRTQDDACRKVLAGRVQACTDACIERARAAVAPEIRDRITGRGCANNCTKLEMFNGHSCP